MRVFITGASGYIGGAVAHRLQADGHAITGLARDPDKAAALREHGIQPVPGTLDDAGVLAEAARAADAVVNAASADHRPAVDALIAALEGSGKPLLHTSGTSIVADLATGEEGRRIFDETTPLDPLPERAARVALDQAVLAAAGRGVRAAVLCNSLIYGVGPGLHSQSVQVPTLVDLARRHGRPLHVGRGHNIWSAVHIDDMAELYALALAKAPPGAFYFVENGEASFKAMADAIGVALGLGVAADWPIDEAIAELGRGKALFTMGSNSRVRGLRARAELGWQPRHASVLSWIAEAVRP